MACRAQHDRVTNDEKQRVRISPVLAGWVQARCAWVEYRQAPGAGTNGGYGMMLLRMHDLAT